VVKQVRGLLVLLLMAFLAGCAAENNVTKTPVPPAPPPKFVKGGWQAKAPAPLSWWAP
jgi:hypothetical protein